MAAPVNSYSTADRLPPLRQGLNLVLVERLNLLLQASLEVYLLRRAKQPSLLQCSVVCDLITVLSMQRCGLQMRLKKPLIALLLAWLSGASELQIQCEAIVMEAAVLQHGYAGANYCSLCLCDGPCSILGHKIGVWLRMMGDILSSVQLMVLLCCL